MQALLLHPHGGTEHRELPTEDLQRLRVLQDLVGGYLEVVPVPGAMYLVFWEGVKDGPHVVNQTATTMARLAESIPPGDYLAGVVLVVPQAALN